MVTVNQDQQSTTILLQPNRSATWRTSKWMIVFICAVVATIALGWFIVGVWMILPFAGFEAGLFGVLMYVVSRQTYREQQLILHKDKIELKNKLGSKVQQLSLSRHLCHIDMVETDRDWHLPQVYLIEDDRRYLIGEFLNLEDRHSLRYALNDEGIPTCRTHWWKEQQ
jgi:uncharacterized membrane protein